MSVRNYRIFVVRAFILLFFLQPLRASRRSWKQEDDSRSNASRDLKEKEKGITKLFSRFADRTSMVGVSYINNAKHIWGRMIWCLLLFLAVGAMCLHLWYLINQYLEYPVVTKVKLSYAILRFPKVTVCNANSVHKSKLKSYKGADELKDLVKELDPKERVPDMYNETWDPLYNYDYDKYDFYSIYDSEYFDFSDFYGIDEIDTGVTGASVTYPGVTDPSVTDPGVTDPSVTDPEVTDPSATDLGVSTPSLTGPSEAPEILTEPIVYPDFDENPWYDASPDDNEYSANLSRAVQLQKMFTDLYMNISK